MNLDYLRTSCEKIENDRGEAGERVSNWRYRGIAFLQIHRETLLEDKSSYREYKPLYFRLFVAYEGLRDQDGGG